MADRNAMPNAENGLLPCTTVRHLAGFVAVVVPGGKLRENEVNVMHLNGSVQTVERAHLTVVFDPRDAVIPPACLCRDPLREVHAGCPLHGHSPESVTPPEALLDDSLAQHSARRRL